MKSKILQVLVQQYWIGLDRHEVNEIVLGKYKIACTVCRNSWAGLMNRVQISELDQASIRELSCGNFQH